LVHQSESGPGQTKERSKREVREEKILDTAAELILRWGYNKTTLDDIARQAGVAKGTLYLHWKTRDDLFLALLRREDLKLAEDARQRIVNDPEGLTLHSLIKHGVLATLKNPFAKAMLLMDSNLLGELVRKDFVRTSFPARMEGWRVFLEDLRAQGAVRADIDIQEHFYMLCAIVMGFLMIDQWMPASFTYSDEAIAEMTSETIQRTLESPDARPVADREASTRAFDTYMDKALELLKSDRHNEEKITS
jgi:AcrR family transcriptional regulator